MTKRKRVARSDLKSLVAHQTKQGRAYIIRAALGCGRVSYNEQRQFAQSLDISPETMRRFIGGKPIRESVMDRIIETYGHKINFQYFLRRYS